MYNNISIEVYLYVQPRIRNLNPDFILIDPKKGVCIIEVKDWEIVYLKQVNRINVETVDSKTHRNPILKANQYFNLTKGLFESEFNLLNDNASLKVNLYSNVIFSNIKSSGILEYDLDKVFNQFPSKYITSGAFRQIDVDSILGENINFLKEKDIITIRLLLFPEINNIKRKN